MEQRITLVFTDEATPRQILDAISPGVIQDGESGLFTRIELTSMDPDDANDLMGAYNSLQADHELGLVEMVAPVTA